MNTKNTYFAKVVISGATAEQVKQSLQTTSQKTPYVIHGVVGNGCAGNSANHAPHNPLGQANPTNTATKPKQANTKGKHPTTAKYGRFDLSRKPSPAEFYHRFGFHLKGNQTLVKCPFHDDKHESMSINATHGAFNCFACGANGGDIIAFYMRWHGCDFITACKQLDIPKEL
ncbi:CHC2 zinc finger domain-containing protein [Moraxella sp. FZLJ2107]|uniref:CHC2 zinc finger domain-containing protein n=1 Tax=unclassified Moraxella TaxID=2685852 RepID=UPI0020C8C0F1|nr:MULTISPECIES: CHC2 zinc finger domain-containing protein [unclassified Moraxella]UTO04790.1 CHC2 zinc finger domain-containing protein [Moraxella sp. FZLJ2107]UTO21522.1 CHC2 zinc finger domain-containing protein [Moraxella sp. FZLJ2109]